MFIGIAGIIGAGKTTLTQQLADNLGYEAFKDLCQKILPHL